MQVWIPALTGARRNADIHNDAEWADVEAERFDAKTIRVRYRNRVYTVNRKHLRSGNCPQCGGWVLEVEPMVLNGPRMCSAECRHAMQVRRSMV